MSLTVYGIAASPFVGKVLTALEEKGIAYKHEPAGAFPKTPELLARSPLGKIPYIQHEGMWLADSSVICAYLERLAPEPALYPKAARDFARALWIEEYSDTRLIESIQPIVLERFVKPKLLGQPGEEALALQAIDTAVPPVFDYLEGQLSDAARFLPQLSIADLAVGCALQTLSLAGVRVDAARWPKLARYAGDLSQRPAFRRQLA